MKLEKKKKHSWVGYVLGAVILVGAASIIILAAQERKSTSSPRGWNVGDVVDVEITLVATDVSNLTCASEVEVAGRHCAFETHENPWSKPYTGEASVLQPYTTTDKRSFLAGGLWTSTGMEYTDLPKGRFSVRCKLKIEGVLRSPSVRWSTGAPWNESSGDWPCGVVSDCSVVR